MDDSIIIDLFWSRSESAINETSAKYGAYCHTIAMNILKNNDDAEECVNDTYLKTWNAIPPQRPIVFSSFIGKITRNLALNKYKEQHAKKRGGSEISLLLDELEDCVSSATNVENEFEEIAVVKAINDFLFSIDERHRYVFVRRYWYAESILTISERFAMSENKIKSILFLTRKKLKIYLEKEGIVL